MVFGGGVISFKLGGVTKGWVGQRSSGNEDMVIGATAGQELLFYENDVEAMRISSGNLGIGTSSPTSFLGGKVTEITNSATAGEITDNQDLIVKSNRFSAISVIGKNTGGSQLNFGDSDNREVGGFQYDHTNDYLITRVNDTERMRIDEFGGLAIKSVGGATTAGFYGGNLVNGITAVPSGVGTPFVLGRDTGTLRSAHFGGNLKFDSGYGVLFGDAGGSGSSSSNTLDSYEEGTWTPTYITSGTAFTAVGYDTPGGRYTKIGNAVHIQAFISTDSIDKGSASGNILIGGLPFNAISNNTNAIDGYAGITISDVQDFAVNQPEVLQIAAGQNYGELLYRSTSNGPLLNMQVSDMGTGLNSNICYISGTYLSA